MAQTQGTHIAASSAQELARVVKAEIETWRKVAGSPKTEKAAGARKRPSMEKPRR